MINRRVFVSSLGAPMLLSAWAKAKDWLATPGPSAPPQAPVQAGDVSAEGPYSIGLIPSLQAGRATFELCEFRIPVRGKGLEGLNPFRATELALDAEFTLPSGKTMRVPGFYSEDYTLREAVRARCDLRRSFQPRCRDSGHKS